MKSLAGNNSGLKSLNKDLNSGLNISLNANRHSFEQNQAQFQRISNNDLKKTIKQGNSQNNINMGATYQSAGPIPHQAAIPPQYQGPKQSRQQQMYSSIISSAIQ